MDAMIHLFDADRNHPAPDPASRFAGRRRLRHRTGALALAGALGLTLAACGGSDSEDSPSAARTAGNGDVFNDADVAFATGMVQHHAQAVAMVVLTDGRPLDPAVERLAQQIRDAQAPEIETMTDWLTDWDQEVPATVNDHLHGGHDMGEDGSGMGGMDMDDTGGDMPGMMGQLEHASDAEFQDLWLQMMVEHHEGAVEMAHEEAEHGTFDDAVALADHIASSQQREIDRMEKMLG